MFVLSLGELDQNEYAIPPRVLQGTGPISHKLKTQSGHLICHHLDHLCICYPPDDNVTTDLRTSD